MHAAVNKEALQGFSPPPAFSLAEKNPGDEVVIANY